MIKKTNYSSACGAECFAENSIERIIDLGINTNKNFSLSNSALIVVDMQKYFFDINSHAYFPAALNIISNVMLLIDSFNKAKRPVIYTKHINNSANGVMMERWWGKIMDSNNPMIDLIDEIKTEKQLIIEKSGYDAFYNTELDDILKSNQINTVVVCGVTTHICCDAALRSAFVRSYFPILAADATASQNEELYFASMLTLSHGIAIPKLSKNIIQQLELKDGK